MKNRSFNHFFGWMAYADGKQAGLTFPDKSGVLHPSHSLSGDYMLCSGNSPDHSYAGSRIEYNGGTMNGSLLNPSNDSFSIGYYGEKDIPFYSFMAPSYTMCDRYFASILGPTFPNRMFLHAA